MKFKRTCKRRRVGSLQTRNQQKPAVSFAVKKFGGVGHLVASTVILQSPVYPTPNNARSFSTSYFPYYSRVVKKPRVTASTTPPTQAGKDNSIVSVQASDTRSRTEKIFDFNWWTAEVKKRQDKFKGRTDGVFVLPSFAGYKSELARFEKRSERGGFFTTKPLSFGEFVLHDTSDKNFTPYIKSIKQPGGFIKMSKPYTKSSTTVLKSNTLGEQN